ncbi:MAG: hypothetical protein KF895_02885 [Parvibaculum sp.]|nr:hypothetical protein [Parvibaculum sp.]
MSLISNIQDRASDAVIAKVGAGMTYTGGGTAAGSGVVAMAQNTAHNGLTLAEWGIVVGMIGVLAGIAIQIFFGVRRDKRESEAHRRVMGAGE